MAVAGRVSGQIPGGLVSKRPRPLLPLIQPQSLGMRPLWPLLPPCHWGILGVPSPFLGLPLH